MLLGDAALVNLAYYCALLLRFEGSIPSKYLYGYLDVALVVTAVSLGSLYVHDLYNRIWKYASTDDLLAIIRAVTVSTVGVAVIGYFSPSPLPRSIPILGWMFNILFIGGSRFVWRLLVDRLSEPRQTVRARKALIVGAGDAGATVARELRHHRAAEIWPVGFVDDDPGKQKMQIFGLPILGTRDDIPRLVQQHGIEEIIIAIPSAPGEVIREIVSICKATPAKLKIVPAVYDLIDGKVTVSQIREVELEDLLGREPVSIDMEEIAGYLGDQVVMVTGAAGSIGSELCRQICRFHPGRLVAVDFSENGLFELEMELKESFPQVPLSVELADIREKRRIERLMEEYRPAVVFHAAAHKHVPLMEIHPEEAVKNNIIGTRNVAEAAARVGVKTFVLISTDKAVNPTSVMGATKRVAEMIIQHLDRVSDTRFAAVRFGNVLGSRGSVIPVFKRQIEKGGPVTVTHPDMVRYFMTVSEAVQLVIQAGAMARGGEVFVLDMGKPVKIVDLARDLIRLSGFEPDKDIKIEFTGIRPGEKLFEELLTAEEGVTATRHRKIYIAKNNCIDTETIEMMLGELNRDDKFSNADSARDFLSRFVPSYRPYHKHVAATRSFG
ncbi:nucleoside-diphosphate sugar epimerase/dehydratase [Calderihabitans maritimus]